MGSRYIPYIVEEEYMRDGGRGILGGLPSFQPTGLPTEDLSVTCTPPKLSLALLCLPDM